MKYEIVHGKIYLFKKKKKKIDGINWRTDFANKVLDSKERYIDIVAYIIEILSDIFRS